MSLAVKPSQQQIDISHMDQEAGDGKNAEKRASPHVGQKRLGDPIRGQDTCCQLPGRLYKIPGERGQKENPKRLGQCQSFNNTYC